MHFSPKVQEVFDALKSVCKKVKQAGNPIYCGTFYQCPVTHFSNSILNTTCVPREHPIDFFENHFKISTNDAWAFIYGYDGKTQECGVPENYLQSEFYQMGIALSKLYPGIPKRLQISYD